MWRNPAAALTNSIQQIWPDIRVKFQTASWANQDVEFQIWSLCPSVCVCESQVRPPFPPHPCFVLLTDPVGYVAMILSPLDLPHHASAVLSEASCSFGSENSVMSVLAGWGGHAIPRLCHGKEQALRPWCLHLLYFERGEGGGKLCHRLAGDRAGLACVCVSAKMKHRENTHLKSQCCRALSWHFDMIHSVESCM